MRHCVIQERRLRFGFGCRVVQLYTSYQRRTSHGHQAATCRRWATIGTGPPVHTRYGRCQRMHLRTAPRRASSFIGPSPAGDLLT